MARCLSIYLIAGVLACSRTPEPGEVTRPTEQSGAAASVDEDGPACVAPLAATPPPAASSLESCPEDPDGAPTMPHGTVRFPEVRDAPTLDVELARTDAHRAHGLMFRPSLTDDAGMLFTFDDQAAHTFWMQNTCLALDMLFIDQDGFVVGILEQVPPWNETRRSVTCASTHVLEVRAGWSRDHGVRPGQRAVIQY